MAVDALIVREGPVNAPLDYPVPVKSEVAPIVISASFADPTNAGPYIPVVEIVTPSGDVIGPFPLGLQIAAGGSARVSWFRAVSEGTSGSTPTSETLMLDTRQAAGITSALVLETGVEYAITCTGTWSYVNKALDVGVPEATALYPTPGGGRLSTQVGFDPETVFAYWSGAVPAGGIGHSALFQMDLGSGFGHVEPSDGAHTVPVVGHSYSYLVTGQGSPASFRFLDGIGQYGDNFGYVRITIETLGANDVPPAGPAGAIFRSVAGVAAWVDQPAVTEADLSLSNVTTADVSTAQHGLAPKAPNDATKYLDGTGAYTVPPGGAPSGPAGGSLAGAYPNPTLAASGVAAGVYGDAGDVPQITVGADGRVTAASNVSIGGGAVVGADGWVDDGAETWTYASATTFTVAGDQTAKYSPGTRIKLTQTTVKYFVVASSVVAAGVTTVTITGGTDYTLVNAAISLNSHSYVLNPQGYPGWFAFSCMSSGWSSTTTNIGRFCVVGRTVIVKYTVTGTSNATSATINLPITSHSVNGFSDNLGRAQNNGVFQASPCLAEVTAGASTVAINQTPTGGGWTASGTKQVSGVLTYEI